VALAAAAAVALGVVCTSSSEDGNSAIHIARISPTPTITGSSAPSPTPSPEPTTPPVLEAVIHGFRYPIEGACLPTNDDLMPNAPREYRFGIHEGIDFYNGDACVPIERGMPVLAAKTGVVIRADHDYQAITAEEMDALLARCEQQGCTSEADLDRLRGCQVWLDHGNGIVTRYAHLLAADEGIKVGMVVAAGQVIGYVGNSGTPEGISDTTLENHLHFEIRVGSGYLGQGLSPEQTRRLCERAFSP
jgi:murein DD-endopeptidase MepM/ murein hydrolase activator NlpD